MKSNRAIALAALVLLVSSGLFLSGCASTGSVSSGSRGGKEPRWVTDKDSAYPPETYLAELGEGDSLDGARASAAASLAGIFRTRVTVDSTIRTRYMEMTGQGDESLGMLRSTEIDETIGQQSDESLVNLHYGETWTSKLGRVYTIAYLDRNETAMLYRQRIGENDARIVELRHRADSQDDPLRRFAFLDAALVTAEINRTLVEQLEIISNPVARSLFLNYDTGELRAAREDQAKALKIRIEVFGDPDGRIAAMLEDWVTRRGFTVSETGNMFLSAIVKTTPVELNNDYENIAWEFNLALMDFLGYQAVTLPATGRSSGISESAAVERAWFDISETVGRDFDRAFSAYLDSFLDK